MASTIDSLGLLAHHHLQQSQPTATDPDTDLPVTDDTTVQTNQTHIINLLNSVHTDLLLPQSQYANLLQYELQSLAIQNTTQSVMIDSIPYIDHSTMTEIGDTGVWSLSSAKSGNGVAELRDNDINTFWQSDGQLPHIINISFVHSLQCVTAIALYTDHKLDESYTPNKISIRLGKYHHTHDSNQYNQIYHAPNNHIYETGIEVKLIELEDPSGWVTIHLKDDINLLNDDQTDDTLSSDNIANTRISTVQIVILSTHQNGRDTHIRQCKLYGPRPHATKGMNTELTNWTSQEFNMYSCIR